MDLRNVSNLRRRAACFFVASLLPILARAESSQTLSGKVQDLSGGAVGGAIVAARRGADAAGRTVTDAAGRFQLLLEPGEYQLSVEAPGFERAERTAAAGAEVVITLQLARTTESITVIEHPGYTVPVTATATRTPTPLRDVPQSVSVVTKELVRDQAMLSMGDVVRYIPGITAVQGENNRDQVVIRGNNSSADFFVNGVRDDVQYFRDLYNAERIEALKGPNAMIFGRGGGGGVINRVTKEAGFAPLREIALQGGSFGNKRVTADWNQALGAKAAVRLNGMFEDSDSYRRFVDLRRHGVNPAATLALTDRTRVTLSYEHLQDRRVADRGVPSFAGRPAAVARSAYFGNPDDSRAEAAVNLGSASVEHQAGRLTIRNRTLAGDYDRFYQNYLPGAVNPAATLVALTAYNSGTARRNFFNQTDFTLPARTGRIRHTLLGGAEFGRQDTRNLRRTGFFDNTATAIFVPLADGVTRTPVTFRPNATDADNQVRTGVAAVYVQDQVQLARRWQVVAGVRLDRFDLRFRNFRTPQELRRIDHLVSPRLGLIFQPAQNVSAYASYSVSWLPGAGDQFAALTVVTQQAKPEKFANYEAGLKWDLARNLSLTAAVYRLDRTNTRATDPNDPLRLLQTGSARTNGFELGANGNLLRRWRVAGGYAYQDARITSATVAARAGARIDQTPRHSFSLWNHYEVRRRLAVGLGILNRADMFAGIDNTVVLPGYTRLDAGVFYTLTERVRVQANVENLTDRNYTLNAHSNTNLTPGSPRAVRIGLVARF